MNVLDLFSGIGGFSLGLERAGMKTVAFCEVDKKCQQVLKKHWAAIPIFNDVTTLSSKDLHEPIDLICGGFPCQDISLAGKGAGLAGERSGLWWQFHRLIKEIKPKYIIAENVAALRSRGLDEVLRSLSEVGYDAEWHCIPASAVGAPHRRDRIWIVSYPNSSMETNGGKCQASQEEGNSRGTEQGGSGWNNREGCFRGSRKSAEDVIPYAINRSSTVRRHWELSDTEKTTILWSNIRRGTQEFVSREWREGEPRPYGVAHGIPNRVDRIKQLGNAVVPQIPEIIGKAIMKVENDSLPRL